MHNSVWLYGIGYRIEMIGLLVIDKSATLLKSPFELMR